MQEIDKQILLIRHARRKDIPELLRIDNACFPTPWNYDEFVDNVWKPNHRNTHCFVVELWGQIVAYVVFILHADRVELKSLAVIPEFQRMGIGTVLIAKLKGRLDPQRRAVLYLMTSERNLDAQLFWRAVGFRASGVIPNAYGTMDEDGYLMTYSILWKY